MVLPGDGTVRATLNGGPISTRSAPASGLTQLRIGGIAGGTELPTAVPTIVRVLPNVELSDLDLQSATRNFTPIVLTSPAIGTSMTLASQGIDPSGRCTVLMMLTSTAIGTGSTQNLFAIDDATLNNVLYARLTAGSGSLQIARVLANGSVVASAIGMVEVDVPYKVGFVMSGDGSVRGSKDGGSVGSVTAGPVIGLTTFRVGNNVANSTPLQGTIPKVAIYPGLVMTDLELQSAINALA
jgi:hypothetical protein